MGNKGTMIKRLALCSAALSLACQFITPSKEIAYAQEQKNGVSVSYKYLTQDELVSAKGSEILEKIKKDDLTQVKVSENETIYLVYQVNPKKIFGVLPATGETTTGLLALSGLVAVIVGVKLKGKNKKKTISSIIVLTAAGSLLAVNSVQALESNALASHNMVYQLNVGDTLAKPAQIDGYHYVGYLSSDLVDDARSSMEMTDDESSRSHQSNNSQLPPDLTSMIDTETETTGNASTGTTQETSSETESSSSSSMSESTSTESSESTSDESSTSNQETSDESVTSSQETSSETSTETSEETTSKEPLVNDVLTQNLRKLNPTASDDDILNWRGAIAENHPLATVKLTGLVPLNGTTVISDVDGKQAQVNRVLAHFENGDTAYYSVQFKENKDDHAHYTTDLGVEYTPRQSIQDYSAIINAVVPQLQAVQYKSEPVYNALGVTSDHENQMDKLFLENTFNKVKADIATYLKKALVNDSTVDPSDSQSVQNTINTILNNKEKVLMSLAYLDRWYDIDYGTFNTKELTMFHTAFFKGAPEALNALLKVGENGYSGYSPQRNYPAYSEHLASITDKEKLTDLLEAYREIFLPNMTNNEWFKQTTDAFIVESKSNSLTADKNAQINVYDRLTNPQVPDEVITLKVKDQYKNMVLPLLTTTFDNTYIVSNMSNLLFGTYDRYIDPTLKATDPAAYETELAKVHKKVESEAELYRAHYDMWYRILPGEFKDKLLYFQPVWGGHGNYKWDGNNWVGVWYSETGKLTQEVADKLGDKATAQTTPAIEEVYGPSGAYFVPVLPNAGAYAGSQEVNFIITDLLGNDGAVTLTHEMVHAFDYDKYLLGHGRRAGMQPEAFPEGMLQAPDRINYGIVGFNSLFDYSGRTGTRYHNVSPERFQSEADLQEYMHGLFDLIYTLEYSEGVSILKQTKDVQRQWLHKLETVRKVYPGYESYGPYGVNMKRDFTDEEWANMNLQSINDLVDYDVTVRRESSNRIERDTYVDGEVLHNGYHKLSLFAPIWATATTDYVPGDLSFRRTAFELLAEKGYVNGAVPYMSNQYKTDDSNVVTDETIFKHVLPEYNGDYKAFKKAMYQERINKLGTLKAVTINYNGQEVVVDSYAKLQQLMDEAVNADIQAGNFTSENSNVSTLKGALYDAYLKATDDYRTTIFE